MPTCDLALERFVKSGVRPVDEVAFTRDTGITNHARGSLDDAVSVLHQLSRTSPLAVIAQRLEL